MHANNEIGTINDIVQIADIAEKYGAYMHTDAVQTVGHLPLDLQNIKVHFYQQVLISFMDLKV